MATDARARLAVLERWANAPYPRLGGESKKQLVLFVRKGEAIAKEACQIARAALDAQEKAEAEAKATDEARERCVKRHHEVMLERNDYMSRADAGWKAQGEQRERAERAEAACNLAEHQAVETRKERDAALANQRTHIALSAVAGRLQQEAEADSARLREALEAIRGYAAEPLRQTLIRDLATQALSPPPEAKCICPRRPTKATGNFFRNPECDVHAPALAGDDCGWVCNGLERRGA